MEENREKEWDKLLGIKTGGRDDSNSDGQRYPYEPTPYSVLERLAGVGYIGKKNTLIDYGCGKGRVDFFLSWQTRCSSIGVEYDKRIFEKAEKNKRSALYPGRVKFCMQDAVHYPVPKEADRFYFFNPFSVEILRGAMERILKSFYEASRELLFFFYYPSGDYLSYLMTVQELEFLDEVDCSDLFAGKDQREKILIFKIPGMEEGNLRL